MIDFKKFLKYSKPGPRYTSYPTAIEFSSSYSYQDHLECLNATSTNSRPLSMYVHLPFCRSACYFCGCNVVYTSKDENKTRYIDFLSKELRLLKDVMNTQKPLEQFHFGGGTPTFFSAKELDFVLCQIKKHFGEFSHDVQASCEIDPRFFNQDQMQVLKDHGFRRLSFGVQDFNDKVQEAVHRIQPFSVSKQAVDLARKNNVKNINIDLIYGLPYQDLKVFKETLEKTVSLDPDRIAIFNYAHVPWLKKTMRKIDETTLPSADVKLEIFKFAIDFLCQNGYEMIGMDHFAKPTDELFEALKEKKVHRNFQGYTTKKDADLIGVGLTSIGNGLDYYAQNVKDLKTYEALITKGQLPLERGIRLSAEDILRKQIIMELMANFYLDISAIEASFNIDFFAHFKAGLESLKELEKDNLLKIDKTKISVNETGKLVIRNIAMAFDGYLRQSNTKTFSNTL